MYTFNRLLRPLQPLLTHPPHLNYQRASTHPPYHSPVNVLRIQCRIRHATNWSFHYFCYFVTCSTMYTFNRLLRPFQRLLTHPPHPHYQQASLHPPYHSPVNVLRIQRPIQCRMQHATTAVASWEHRLIEYLLRYLLPLEFS